MITWPAIAASMKMYNATNPSAMPIPQRCLRPMITIPEPAATRVNPSAARALPVTQDVL
jgi:hypothetical protein